MEPSTDSSPGLFSSVKRLLNTALAGVENRIELFLVELREARVRVFDVVLLGCAAAVLGFMAWRMVTATLGGFFWVSGGGPGWGVWTAGYSLATTGVRCGL